MFIKVFCSDSDADQMINRSINQIWEKNEKIKTKAKVFGHFALAILYDTMKLRWICEKTPLIDYKAELTIWFNKL